MPEAKPGPLEISDETREHLVELQGLSEKAEAGDKEARKELRQLVHASSLEVIAHASDIAKRVQWVLVKTISAEEPLMEEALEARMQHMRAEIAGENPTPLEVLLTERVVACWMLVELFDVLMAAQLNKDNEPRTSISYTLKMLKWRESANRRHFAAIRELARVRKLEVGTPAVQYNTQVNILRG